MATDSLLYTANLIAVLAPLLVAAGLLMVSLNSMRVGLLTRFLGVLGMLSAALAILSQFLFSFVLTFWLISLGLLFLEHDAGRRAAGLAHGQRRAVAEPARGRRGARCGARVAQARARTRAGAGTRVRADGHAPASGVEEAQAQAPRLSRFSFSFGRGVEQRVDRDEQPEPAGERSVAPGSVARAPVQFFARQAQVEGDGDRS